MGTAQFGQNFRKCGYCLGRNLGSFCLSFTSIVSHDIHTKTIIQYVTVGKCVYEGKCRSKCIIYEVKCYMCDAIYIGKTQQTFKKRMDGNFSDPLCLLKNGQKSDSFAAHFEQHFNTNMSRTYICKYMSFKLVKQINPIGAMKSFTKPNFNLCIEERLTILKKLRDKRVTIMNNNF